MFDSRALQEMPWELKIATLSSTYVVKVMTLKNLQQVLGGFRLSPSAPPCKGAHDSHPSPFPSASGAYNSHLRLSSSTLIPARDAQLSSSTHLLLPPSPLTLLYLYFWQAYWTFLKIISKLYPLESLNNSIFLLHIQDIQYSFDSIVIWYFSILYNIIAEIKCYFFKLFLLITF